VPIGERERIEKVLRQFEQTNTPGPREQSRSIGIPLPFASLVDDYIGKVVQGIARAADRHGYDLHIYGGPATAPGQSLTARQTLAHYENAFAKSPSDGWILVIPDQANTLFNLCRIQQGPHVLIDYQEDDVRNEANRLCKE